jgi:predicted phosphatase
VIFLDIGGIVDHHSMSSTIPPISTKITSHLNSLNDGQQFHQYQQKSPLTSTH